jgi:DNA invertase Pin-like site-specific DNA recombinase
MNGSAVTYIDDHGTPAERSVIGYIRRSFADKDSPGDVSREVQERAVFDLAEKDDRSPHDVHLFVDWSKSADEEKESKRTDYIRMVAEIEAGRVSVLYAYSLDRLARSTMTFAKLLKAAKTANVRVVTAREGDLSDTGNPMTWAFGFLVSFFAEFELRMIKARVAAAQERRVARGDRMGHAPYGYKHVKEGGVVVRVDDPSKPPAPIRQAYLDAGTVLGACRLLRERGITSPKGTQQWGPSTLTRVLENNWPELLPHRSATGRREKPPEALFAKLLACHCSDFDATPPQIHLLTPNRVRGQYYCSRGHVAGDHGRYVTREADILAWAKLEASRLQTPDRVETSKANEERRLAIESRMERARELYLDEGDKTRWAVEKARAQEFMRALDAEIALELVPDLDWSWPAARVNEVLCAMWSYVVVDAEMRPVRAQWFVPEWVDNSVN